MKIAIVGEAPGRGLEGPPNGQIWRKLSRLAGRDVSWFADAVNLLGFWPGAASKGSVFPRSAAVEAARAFPRHRYDRVVMLGWRVADAFARVVIGVPSWRRVSLQWWLHLGSEPSIEPRFAVLPHPSGVNAWWNDPKNRRAASRFLRDLAAEARKDR
jgi:hypothetical protein